MKKKRLEIIWKGQVVGFLETPNFDNFDLYGKWVSANSIVTQEFLLALEMEEEVEVLVGNEKPELIGTVDISSGNEINIKMRPYLR